MYQSKAVDRFVPSSSLRPGDTVVWLSRKYGWATGTIKSLKSTLNIYSTKDYTECAVVEGIYNPKFGKPFKHTVHLRPSNLIKVS